jgi:hypothetical protein
MSAHHSRLGFLLAFTVAAPACAADPPPRLRVLVPAYFYPADQGLKHWDRLLESPIRADVVAVVNPASGPGDKEDPNYTKIVGRAAKAGVTPIGYVTTGYGKRPPQQVKGDVDKWVRLYPDIQGIFFDEQNSGADFVDHQAELYDYVRKKKQLKLVITNPGTVCAEGYLTKPAADAACLFEGPKGLDDYRPPAWAERLAAPHFVALAYQVAKAEQMQAYVRAAAEKKIGYIYVTDGEGANPWDRLPSFWDDEVAAVRKANEKADK